MYPGNMSKQTREWADKLLEAEDQENPFEQVLHTAYRLVNEEVASGIAWSKCQNCGSPYRLDRGDGANATFCATACFHEALVALEEE